MPSATPSFAELSFERALARLESLVARLEEGDLDLEEALRAFEEGVGLSRRCAEQLEAAERRIELLAREGAGSVERALGADGSDGGD